MGAFFYFKISSTSISQPQLPVIQTTNSTLPQKHPNSPLNLFTSISTTQLSGKHPGYVLSMQFFRYLGLTLSPVNFRKSTGNTALFTPYGQPVTSILPSQRAPSTETNPPAMPLWPYTPFSQIPSNLWPGSPARRRCRPRFWALPVLQPG